MDDVNDYLRIPKKAKIDNVGKVHMKCRECCECGDCFCGVDPEYGSTKENGLYICGYCNRDEFFASCCEKDLPMTKYFFTCRTCDKENCIECWPNKEEHPKCVKCGNYFCKSCARFGSNDMNGVFICDPCDYYEDNEKRSVKNKDDSVNKED